MNKDELTRDGESCLSVCEWTADTPGCYTPQREKSHLLTGSDRVAPPRLTDGFSSERRFNPRGRNTHTHTHLNAASKTTWKNLIFTEQTECPSPRGEVSLFSLSSRTSATWIRLKTSRTGSDASGRSTCWKESDTSCWLTDEKCPCGYRL